MFAIKTAWHGSGSARDGGDVSSMDARNSSTSGEIAKWNLRSLPRRGAALRPGLPDLVHRLEELVVGFEALLRLLLEKPQDQMIRSRRDPRVQAPRLRRRLGGVLVQQGCGSVGREGPFPRQHFEQGHAQGV